VGSTLSIHGVSHSPPLAKIFCMSTHTRRDKLLPPKGDPPGNAGSGHADRITPNTRCSGPNRFSERQPWRIPELRSLPKTIGAAQSRTDPSQGELKKTSRRKARSLSGRSGHQAGWISCDLTHSRRFRHCTRARTRRRRSWKPEPSRRDIWEAPVTTPPAASQTSFYAARQREVWLHAHSALRALHLRQ
jgi:hypothetical protein